jgi:hypothetical protein
VNPMLSFLQTGNVESVDSFAHVPKVSETCTAVIVIGPPGSRGGSLVNGTTRGTRSARWSSGGSSQELPFIVNVGEDNRGTRQFGASGERSVRAATVIDNVPGFAFW